ncbi:MAG: B12-binding domain-containing radical SAM protein [Planctomycetota bacterium]
MRSLLISLTPPASAWPKGDFRCHWVPTGLAYLATALRRAGSDVRIVHREQQLTNLGFDFPQADADLRQTVRNYRPDMVGFSSNSASVGELDRLSRLCRGELGESAVLLAGGPHPTALGEETLEECPALDAVAVGEAERTLEELAKTGLREDVAGLVVRRNGDYVRTRPRPPEHDLDSLGEPAMDLLDWSFHTARGGWMIRYLPLRTVNVHTSRGCTNRCSFCAGHLIGGVGVRPHSIEYVMERVRFAVERMGAEAILFDDDTLGADPSRLMELCEALCRAGFHRRIVWGGCLRVDQTRPDVLAAMNSAGCVQVEFGFESGSDEGLRAMGKGTSPEMNVRAAALTRQAGLRVFGNVILGTPGETAAGFDATVKMVRRIKPDVLSAARLCPLPGTRVYKSLTPEQRSRITWESLAYMNMPCNLTGMSDEQFEERFRAFRRYFFVPLMDHHRLRDGQPCPSRRGELRRRLHSFAVRHPVRALRLPWNRGW